MEARNRKIVWSASPTPFLSDGSLDPAGIDNLIEQHQKLGVDGLFLGGTCGEGPFTPTSQRLEMIRMVKKSAGDCFTLCSQVSDTSAARVKDNIQSVADLGIDFVVIARPIVERFYDKIEMVRRYFFEAIESSPLPVAIYMIGKPDEEVLGLDLWIEIASHPNVKFVKDSTASNEFRTALCKLKKKRPELTVLTGNEFDVIGAVKAGYDGGLLGTGILNAGMIRRAVDAVANGKTKDAQEWQDRSNAFLWDLFEKNISLWLGGLKYALKKLGIFNDEFMHLHFPLTDAQCRRIDEALEREREFI